jgi:hypothetical protein
MALCETHIPSKECERKSAIAELLCLTYTQEMSLND